MGALTGDAAAPGIGHRKAARRAGHTGQQSLTDNLWNALETKGAIRLYASTHSLCLYLSSLPATEDGFLSLLKTPGHGHDRLWTCMMIAPHALNVTPECMGVLRILGV